MSSAQILTVLILIAIGPSYTFMVRRELPSRDGEMQDTIHHISKRQDFQRAGDPNPQYQPQAAAGNQLPQYQAGQTARNQYPGSIPDGLTARGQYPGSILVGQPEGNQYPASIPSEQTAGNQNLGSLPDGQVLGNQYPASIPSEQTAGNQNLGSLPDGQVLGNQYPASIPSEQTAGNQNPGSLPDGQPQGNQYPASMTSDHEQTAGNQNSGSLPNEETPGNQYPESKPGGQTAENQYPGSVEGVFQLGSPNENKNPLLLPSSQLPTNNIPNSNQNSNFPPNGLNLGNQQGLQSNMPTPDAAQNSQTRQDSPSSTGGQTPGSATGNTAQSSSSAQTAAGKTGQSSSSTTGTGGQTGAQTSQTGTSIQAQISGTSKTLSKSKTDKSTTSQKSTSNQRKSKPTTRKHHLVHHFGPDKDASYTSFDEVITDYPKSADYSQSFLDDSFNVKFFDKMLYDSYDSDSADVNEISWLQSALESSEYDSLEDFQDDEDYQRWVAEGDKHFEDNKHKQMEEYYQEVDVDGKFPSGGKPPGKKPEKKTSWSRTKKVGKLSKLKKKSHHKNNSTSDSNFFLLYSLPCVLFIIVGVMLWRNLRGKVKVVHVDQLGEENSTWNPDYAKHIDAKAKELEPMLEAHEKEREGWQ